MSLAKIVGVTCVLYLVFALQSLLGNGVFLPILPLKEVFVGGLALTLALFSFKKDRRLYLYLCFYGVVSLLFSQFFLELVMESEERLQLNSDLFDYIGIAKVLLVSIFLLYLTFERIESKVRVNIFPLLSLLALISTEFLDFASFQSLVLLPLSIALYIQYFKREQEEVDQDKYQALKFWIIAFSVLGLIDHIALLLHS